MSLPVGGFDAGALAGPFELRLSRLGDRFHALDEDNAVDVPPGEVSYAVGNEVLTRHFVWRQSRRGLIGPGTTDAILVSEILGILVIADPRASRPRSRRPECGRRVIRGYDPRYHPGRDSARALGAPTPARAHRAVLS
jgi:hypothetical protein